MRVGIAGGGDPEIEGIRSNHALKCSHEVSSGTIAT